MAEIDEKFARKTMTSKKATDKNRTDGAKQTKNIILHIVYENDKAEENEAQQQKQHLSVF